MVYQINHLGLEQEMAGRTAVQLLNARETNERDKVVIFKNCAPFIT